LAEIGPTPSPHQDAVPSKQRPLPRQFLTSRDLRLLTHSLQKQQRMRHPAFEPDALTTLGCAGPSRLRAIGELRKTSDQHSRRPERTIYGCRIPCAIIFELAQGVREGPAKSPGIASGSAFAFGVAFRFCLGGVILSAAAKSKYLSSFRECCP